MSNLNVNQITADRWVNSDGTENFKCRAWVNFNGIGNVAIRDSGNVSSIVDIGTGSYEVHFITPMPHTNYAFLGAVGGAAKHDFFKLVDGKVPEIDKFHLLTFNTGGSIDVGYITMAVVC